MRNLLLGLMIVATVFSLAPIAWAASKHHTPKALSKVSVSKVHDNTPTLASTTERLAASSSTSTLGLFSGFSTTLYRDAYGFTRNHLTTAGTLITLAVILLIAGGGFLLLTIQKVRDFFLLRFPHGNRLVSRHHSLKL